MAFLNFGDYAVFITTLVFSLGIGLFYSCRGRNQKTTKHFILGDGNMSSLPVALSAMVSYISGITMLGVPAEVYIYGVQWYVSMVSVFISNLLTLNLVIPSLWKLNTTSMNQYFELRFNSHGLRIFATVINLLSLLNYMGNVLFVPAVTLEIVAGIPMETSIITLTVVVLVYTIIGGFKAVIWTDVFQCVLMFGGMFAILFKGTIETGGPTNTWNIVKEKGRLNLFDFNPDPTLRQSFWSLFVWGMITGFRLQFTQATFQRVKATPSIPAAKRMFLISCTLFLIISTLAMLEGAVMFAYYHTKGCDLLASKQVRNQNQLIARMVRDIFQDIPCLTGLFLAALFSASLSTMSSILSAMSALFWEDIVKPHIRPLPDRLAMRIAQFSVFLFGGLTIVVAFGISEIQGPISRILDITGACMNGAFYGMILFGWFIPRANALGTLVGGVVSFLVVGWISLGKLLSSGVRVNVKLEPASTQKCDVFNNSGLVTEYDQNSSYTVWKSITTTTQISTIRLEPQGLDVLYSLSYKWLLPVGVGLVFAVGSIFSRLQAKKPVDPSLVIPVCGCLKRDTKAEDKCCSRYPDTNQETLRTDEQQRIFKMDTMPVGN